MNPGQTAVILAYRNVRSGHDRENGLLGISGQVRSIRRRKCKNNEKKVTDKRKNVNNLLIRR